MSEEFCAGVRILIERMQTNPEDFADEEHDLANMRRTKMYRFGAFASRLERIITGHHKDEVLAKWPEWHYLTQAEQDALIEAFKAMRRTEFDKRIMERVFDDKFYERQEEEERQYVFSKTQQAQLQAQMRASQSAMAQTHIGTITAGQPGALYYTSPNNVSPADNGGILGSLGRALGFK
jgi:hypothetical protein